MGTKKSSSSSLSLCGMLKACFSSTGSCSSRDEYYSYYDDDEDISSRRRIFASDEDRGRNWVAEPGIDGKASAFIARFYANRLTHVDGSEQQQQQLAS